LRQSGDIRRVDAVRGLQSLRIIDPDAKRESIIDELINQAPDLIGGNNGNGKQPTE